MISLKKGSTRAVRSVFSRALWGSVISTLVLCAASSASAEEVAARAPAPCACPCPCLNGAQAKEPQGPLVDNAYGLQTLAFDGAALALMATYLSSNGAGGQVLPAIAATSYLGGGPGVHLAHGHIDKAAASLGLRAGLPFAFGIAGGFIAAANQAHGEFDALGGLFIGTVAGMVTASALDAALVAREKVPAPPPREAGQIAGIAPSVSVLPQGGAMVSLGGTIF